MVSIFYYVTNVLSTPSQIITIFIMGFLGGVASFRKFKIILITNCKLEIPVDMYYCFIYCLIVPYGVVAFNKRVLFEQFP